MTVSHMFQRQGSKIHIVNGYDVVVLEPAPYSGYRSIINGWRRNELNDSRDKSAFHIYLYIIIKTGQH